MVMTGAPLLIFQKATLKHILKYYIIEKVKFLCLWLEVQTYLGFPGGTSGKEPTFQCRTQ